MKSSNFATTVLGGLALLAGSITAASAAGTGQPRPMFAVQPGLRPNLVLPSGRPTWNFSFTYKGSSYTDALVGTAPTGGASTTVPVYIIPLKLVYATTTRSALQVLPNGRTVVQNVIDSPMFDATTNYTLMGTNIGNTQYADAYERANLWGSVASHAGYHVLLGAPTVTKLSTLKIPSAQGAVANAFNTSVILVNINYFDGKIQALIKSLHVPSNALPIFVTTDTYLTGGSPTLGNCCIGGYHGTTNASGQPYMHATYIQTAGAFSQDVSALSHEIGEWVLDPNTNNNSPCGIMENGDPLERNANFGDFPYTVNGFTYNLQDLVFLPYFGAPKPTTVHGWSTFHNFKLSVCQNGA